jgi:hypothetical protein
MCDHGIDLLFRAISGSILDNAMRKVDTLLFVQPAFEQILKRLWDLVALHQICQ